MKTIISDINWNETKPDFLIRIHKEGYAVIDGRIVMGGNGRWTPSIFISHMGRIRKFGIGRLKSRTVDYLAPDEHQFTTLEEAIAWADVAWVNALQRLHNQPEIIATPHQGQRLKIPAAERAIEKAP